MWVYEHSVVTDAAPEAVWRLWADVAGWGGWNVDIERIELRGPFAADSRVTMTPIGQEPVELRIGEVRVGELFVDEAEIDGLLLRTMHRIDRLDRGIRVTYRLEITGPDAERVGPELGPAVSSDWPDTMAALVARAGRDGA